MFEDLLGRLGHLRTITTWKTRSKWGKGKMESLNMFRGWSDESREFDRGSVYRRS